MGVEDQMSEMIGESEKDLSSPLSLVSKIRALSTEGIEVAASNPESHSFQVVQNKYPNILDRELLAGAIDKQFLGESSDLSKEIEDIYDRNEQAIEQGHRGTSNYDGLMDKRSKFFDLSRFLTIMNDAENDKTLAEIERREKQEEKAIEDETKRHESVSRFREYSILIPSTKTESDNVEMTLSEYLSGIARKTQNRQFTRKECETRVMHLKANFNFAFEPGEKKYVLEEYETKKKEAQKEWEKWQSQAILHELEKDEIKAADTSSYNLRIASLELDIILELLK